MANTEVPTKQIYVLRDFSKAVVTDVADILLPDNAVPHSVNVVYDEILGIPKTRKGLTIVNTQIAANPGLGLYNFRDTARTTETLLAVVSDGTNNDIYRKNGANWTKTLEDDTKDKKTRFETFCDTVIRVNGTNPAKTWTGTGDWVTTEGNLDVGNFPAVTGNLPSFVRCYQDRMYALTASGTLYYSSVAGGTVGSEVISWTTPVADNIRINPEDGQLSTGINEVSGLLVIFKEKSMYTYNGSSTQADLVIDVGCSSNESIAVGNGVMYFFNEDGIWVTKGAMPIKISDPVKKWINNMSADFYEHVNGAYHKGSYYCSIGDVTISGRTFSNVVLKYNSQTQQWAVYSYAFQMRWMTEWISSNTVYMAGIDSLGRVYQMETGTADNTSPINCEIETKELEFGSRGFVKEIYDRIVFLSKYSNGINLSVIVDGADELTLGGADRNVRVIDIPILRGNHFKFKASWSTTNERTEMLGWEFPTIKFLDLTRP